MSKKIELYEFQKESVKEVISSLSRGLRTLLCLPTGAGKTLVAKEVVDEYLNAGLTVLWLTHRCELKSQVLGVFGENKRFEVCLVRSRGSLKNVDLIVVDEAHHSAAPSYRSHFKQSPKAKVFGLSATPVRLDGKSLKDYFDVIIQPRSALTSALISQGFLADIELFVPDSNESKLCGEVIANNLNVKKSVLDGLKFIGSRKGITFCTNKDHALAVAEEFKRHGVKAEAVDSETPYDARMGLLDRWNANKIQVIVNCELYTEGSDLPGVDFVQILRPTESLSLYFQMIGRGMRSGMPMRLLDHTSNWKTIGLPKDDFIFTLDTGNESAYFKLADEAKRTLPEKQSDTEPEHVDIGDLIEFNLAKESHSSSGHKARAKALPKIVTDYPAMRYLFVTLTLKDCAIDDLRKTIIHLNKSFSRLAGIKEFPAVGYMKTVEVTRGKSGDCQLYLHVLMGVKASYFGNRYISKKDWCFFWKRSAKLDYTPTIEVQATSPKASPLELLAEIVKYQNKPNNLIFADRKWFLEYTKQIKGTKTFASGGIFKDYFKELDKEETIDEMVGNNEAQEGANEGEMMPLTCELHTPDNLQILEASVNLSKSNKFEPYIEPERDLAESWKVRSDDRAPKILIDRASTHKPKAVPSGQLALF